MVRVNPSPWAGCSTVMGGGLPKYAAKPGQSRISGAVCRNFGDCTRVCPAGYAPPSVVSPKRLSTQTQGGAPRWTQGPRALQRFYYWFSWFRGIIAPMHSAIRVGLLGEFNQQQKAHRSTSHVAG